MKKNTKTNGVLDTSSINLETGLVLVQGLVYSIVNETSKIVLVGSTTNLYQAIGRVLEVIKSGSREYGSLGDELGSVSVNVLETTDKANLKICTSKWIRHYKNLGYKFYKDMNPVLYTLSSEWGYKEGRIHYFVYLKNKRNDKKLVGVFKKKKEMSEWIRTNYPDSSRITSIVYQSSLEGSRDNNNKGSPPTGSRGQ